MMGRHSKKRWRPIVSAILTLLSAMVVAAYLVVPGMWQWNRAEAKVEAKRIHQVDTVPGEVDGALVQRLRDTSASAQSAPIIITYHDISYNPSRYTVTPENFAAQMQLIHDAGWTTLTTDQLDGWLGGAPLPPHSVMITFDDGATGVWQYADPVLKRLDMHATAFIITGFVGTHAPYYMTWDQVTELANNGHWDIEAHTHLGHVQVPSDNEGNEGPFLNTVAWLPDQHRFETHEEYRLRVNRDLTECKHQFALHGLPEPKFFAYPFSAYRNDREGSGQPQASVVSLYRAGLLDDAEFIAVTAANVARGLIQRMDITADLSLDKFIRKIDLASPLDPPAAQPLSDVGGWSDEKQNEAAIDIANGIVTIGTDTGEKVIRNYAPARSAMWNDYTVSVDVGGFSLPADGSQAGISVLKPPGSAYEQEGRVDLTVYAHAYSIQGLVNIDRQPLVEADRHHVVIDVTDTQVVVTVDDAPPTVIDIPPHAARTVGGGMALYAFRRTDVNPSLTFTNLTIS
jgi:peptidoglycan/xylan/chitin deacetylase (PgdA/CDA1 family)